jgi:ABC-type sugar transport system ATPase subunit
MMVRTQIALPPEEHRKAKAKAAELNISLAEYVRRLVARDLDHELPRGDITQIFGLARSGRSDVSENVDKYVGEAVEAEYRRETGN